MKSTAVDGKGFSADPAVRGYLKTHDVTGSDGFRGSQGKMPQHTVKRPAVRARWELEEYAMEKLEILRSRQRRRSLTDAAYPLRVHKGFLLFSNLGSAKNLSPKLLAELCGVAIDII